MSPRATRWLLALTLWAFASVAWARHPRGRDAGADDASVTADAGPPTDAAPPSDAAVPSDATPPTDAEGTTAREPGPTSLPTGRGLPVVVRAAVRFVDLRSIEENDGAFKGTIDVRLQWDDPRQAFPPGEAAGYREWRGEEVEARLGEMWSPGVVIDNLDGDPDMQIRGLRVTPAGHVELMIRTRGTFASSFDAADFPFDTQRLAVALACTREADDEVALEFRQDDLDFGRESPPPAVEGWDADLVSLRSDPQGGWHGAQHARVIAELEVARVASRTAPAIFIPLLASLLIPLLAIWLNRAKRGGFAIEAFELTNVVVGGLFAVIALNFTVNAEYKLIASGDNTVSRLFALNYLTLAVSLLVNIAVYRFNVVKKLFGAHVEEQVYRVCLWAVPTLSLATAAAVVMAAVAS
ncbi:MAG: hypothetical protein U0324_07165 [Polyangiales bacterium]